MHSYLLNISLSKESMEKSTLSVDDSSTVKKSRIVIAAIAACSKEIFVKDTTDLDLIHSSRRPPAYALMLTNRHGIDAVEMQNIDWI